MEEVYIDSNDHIQYIIKYAASYETPPILMNDIPMDDIEEGKIWCSVKPNGENVRLQTGSKWRIWS